jgi:hypothetical protein
MEETPARGPPEFRRKNDWKKVRSGSVLGVRRSRRAEFVTRDGEGRSERGRFFFLAAGAGTVGCGVTVDFKGEKNFRFLVCLIDFRIGRYRDCFRLFVLGIALGRSAPLGSSLFSRTRIGRHRQGAVVGRSQEILVWLLLALDSCLSYFRAVVISGMLVLRREH